MVVQEKIVERSKSSHEKQKLEEIKSSELVAFLCCGCDTIVLVGVMMSKN